MLPLVKHLELCRFPQVAVQQEDLPPMLGQSKGDVGRHRGLSLVFLHTAHQKYFTVFPAHMGFQPCCHAPAGFRKVHAHQRGVQQQGGHLVLPLLAMGDHLLLFKGNCAQDIPVQQAGCRGSRLDCPTQQIDQSDQTCGDQARQKGQFPPAGHQERGIGGAFRHRGLLHHFQGGVGKHIPRHLLIVAQGRLNEQVRLPGRGRGGAEHQQVGLLNLRAGDGPLYRFADAFRHQIAQGVALENLAVDSGHLGGLDQGGVGVRAHHPYDQGGGGSVLRRVEEVPHASSAQQHGRHPAQHNPPVFQYFPSGPFQGGAVQYDCLLSHPAASCTITVSQVCP